MNNITALKLTYEFFGMKEVIYPVIIKSGDNLILVDGGCTGKLNELELAMKQNGFNPAKLTHVIITHHDHDHMGVLSELKSKYPDIKVAASQTEAPHISGIEKSPRLEQAKNLLNILPEDKKAFGKAFYSVLESVVPLKVDIILHDDELLDWCSDFQVINTNGHTKGHISLYNEADQILITGDAAALEHGNLAIANPELTMDMDNANASLEKLKRMDAKVIVCYHGGVLKKL